MKPDLITSKQWIWYNTLLVVEHMLGVHLSDKLLAKSKDRLTASILKNPGIQERGAELPVKEISAQDFPEFIKNKHLLEDNVYVFRGAAKDWPCTQKWSLDFFDKNYGDYVVALLANKGLASKQEENKQFKEITLREYLASFSNNSSRYLRFSRIIDEHPDTLKKDVDVNWLNQFKKVVTWGDSIYLFLGKNGTYTSMHNAAIQSLFVQVKGQKTWTFYKPEERIFLEARTARLPYFYTDYNPGDTNKELFPLAEYAKKYTVTAGKGDVLWFPAFYWHHVKNCSDTIGFTHKHINIPMSFRQSKMLTVLFFLATKPTLLRTFLYNKWKGRDYVFDNPIE